MPPRAPIPAMRFAAAGLVALLAVVVLVPAAGALPGLDAAQELVRHVFAPTPGAGVGEVVRETVTPAPVESQASGPAPPAQIAERAAGDALLWLLAAGGMAGSVALGWRHLHRANVLDHAGRVALLRLLRAQPGLHLRALARATGQPAAQADYHLRVLDRMGLVGSQMLAGRKCYHEAGAAPEVRRALAEQALQPGEAAKRVLAFVLTHPGASQSEVARELGMLPGSARWHLQRLATKGKLEEARAGKALVYRPRVSSGPRP
jgi:DNA-binding transcriptional ArsR family regulator